MSEAERWRKRRMSESVVERWRKRRRSERVERQKSGIYMEEKGA